MFELVPPGFEVPSGLEHERFRLRMMTVDDVVADFEALCSRVDHDGRPQPPFVPTVALNLVDLSHRAARNPPTNVRTISRSALATASASSGSWPSTQPVRTSSSAPYNIQAASRASTSERNVPSS